MTQSPQTREERILIVRSFCRTLTNKALRRVCKYYQKNVPERDICRKMRLKRASLEDLKAQIASGLLEAGIRFA